MDKLIYKIEDIVRKCGKQVLSVEKEKMKIETKEGLENIVTQYDKKIETELKEEFLGLLPNASFIGEEQDLNSEILKEGYTFSVDPKPPMKL